MIWWYEMNDAALAARDAVLDGSPNATIEASRAYWSVVRELCQHTANTTTHDGEVECSDCGATISEPAR